MIPFTSDLKMADEFLEGDLDEVLQMTGYSTSLLILNLLIVPYNFPVVLLMVYLTVRFAKVMTYYKFYS